MSTRTVHFAPQTAGQSPLIPQPPDVKLDVKASPPLHAKNGADPEDVDYNQSPPLTRADWEAAAPAIENFQSPTLVVYGRILNDEHHIRKELAHLLQAQHDYHGTLATIISHLEMMLRDARDLAKRFQAGGL